MGQEVVGRSHLRRNTGLDVPPSRAFGHCHSVGAETDRCSMGGWQAWSSCTMNGTLASRYPPWFARSYDSVA